MATPSIAQVDFKRDNCCVEVENDKLKSGGEGKVKR